MALTLKGTHLRAGHPLTGLLTVHHMSLASASSNLCVLSRPQPSSEDVNACNHDVNINIFREKSPMLTLEGTWVASWDYSSLNARRLAGNPGGYIIESA